MSQLKTTLLVDGNNLLSRAGFSDPQHLTGGPNNEPIGARLVALRMIKNLADTFLPHKIIVAWDIKRSNYRLTILPSYKGQRDPNNPTMMEIKPQMAPFRDLTKNLGIQHVLHPELEADDILSWICYQGTPEDHFIICSSDLDFAQLVRSEMHHNGKVSLQTSKQLITSENSSETLEFAPERIIEWKALQGDKSDNIPGLPRIGEGTATKWIKATTSQKELYPLIEEHETKYKKKNPEEAITPFKETFERNLTLVTLKLWEVETPHSPSNDAWLDIAYQLCETPPLNLELFTQRCLTEGFPSIGKMMPSWAKNVCNQNPFEHDRLL
jgi:DNA polymerase-1